MQLCETGKHPSGELEGGRNEKIREKMKHSLMISLEKKEKFWLLRGMVLWEKCKHSYILFQQTSSLLLRALKLLSSQLLPRSKALSRSLLTCGDVSICVGAPRGTQSGPSGQPGLCSATADCRDGELVVQGTPTQAVGHVAGTSTPRPSPQHPWYTETERVLGSPLFIDSTSGQRMMG